MTHMWDRLAEYQREKIIVDINAITEQNYRLTLRVVPYHQLPGEVRAAVHTYLFELDLDHE